MQTKWLTFDSSEFRKKLVLDGCIKKIEGDQHSETTLVCLKEYFYHNMNLPLDKVSVHTYLSVWRPDYHLILHLIVVATPQLIASSAR